MLINFNDYPKTDDIYAGANGGKIAILINNEVYMLKLPIHAQKNLNMIYSDSFISEYLGSHIFNMLGIDAQETILGTYTYHGKELFCVACKDFTYPSYELKDFASLKNTIINSETGGYGTDINEVIETIISQDFIDKKELLDYFWDIFVVDAFIGNWDRHNANWGFLFNKTTKEKKIAPIFDCASSLYPQADDKMIKERIMISKAEILDRIYKIPTSALYQNGHRINFYDFLISHKYKECDEAIRRIVPKINLIEINQLIDDCPGCSTIKKDFLKKMLSLRKTLILDKAMQSIKK